MVTTAEEWARIPGLFGWSVVRELSQAARADSEWRFVVKRHSVGKDGRELYCVEMFVGRAPGPSGNSTGALSRRR